MKSTTALAAVIGIGFAAAASNVFAQSNAPGRTPTNPKSSCTSCSSNNLKQITLASISYRRDATVPGAKLARRPGPVPRPPTPSSGPRSVPYIGYRPSPGPKPIDDLAENPKGDQRLLVPAVQTIKPPPPRQHDCAEINNCWPTHQPKN